VYCASSGEAAPEYRDAARELGDRLARDGRTIIYGGSRAGSMGALADGALAAGGRVIGVLPRFLQELEVAHESLSELHIVDDMRARKHRMLASSCAVIALPGGSGTFEELLEAITLKRLGVYRGPIILVNTRNYYRELVAMLDRAIQEGFMRSATPRAWQVVATADEAVSCLPSPRQ
jgi:uncharacterized protein (TIGR00730 family)